MIEASDLTSLAITRRAVLLLPREGQEPITAIALWHERATPENKIERDDAWRVLVFDAGNTWAVLVFAADAVLLEGTNVEIPPIDPGAPTSPADGRPFVESVALACYLGASMRFDYRKVGGGPVEARRGKCLGTKNGMLFVEDADRDGAKRSFKLDGIAGFAPIGDAARWDGATYVMPAAAPVAVPEGW